MKNKVTLLNVIASLTAQLVSIISAFIVPKLILSTFGSNANGLISSIYQFLNYIALVEGGITGVISANLYKPLVNGDNKKLSSIISTARRFYRKIGYIFAVYSIIVASLYPVLVNTGYSNAYVFGLTIVLSISLMMQYMFSLTYTTLLNADKKVYIVSFCSAIVTAANIFLTIIIIRAFPDLILVKLSSSILFCITPIIYGTYIHRHYNIDWNAENDNSLIEQRWNGFAINIAFFIHTSTDIALLTFFSDLRTVSVYSVYSLVISKISILIHSIASGVEPTIGQAYARGNYDELNKKMDLYEFVIFISVGIIFTMVGILITPFVMTYTKGITDADYYQPIFGAILTLAEACYLIRYPHMTLSYAANKFKEITIPAYLEAGINIVISICLVDRLGLIGIALGTLAGMIYRTVFHVYFTSKIMRTRKQHVFYKKLLIICCFSSLAIFLCKHFNSISIYSYSEWILHAIIDGVICVTLFLICAFIFFRNELKAVFIYFRRKK